MKFDFSEEEVKMMLELLEADYVFNEYYTNVLKSIQMKLETKETAEFCGLYMINSINTILFESEEKNGSRITLYLKNVEGYELNKEFRPSDVRHTTQDEINQFDLGMQRIKEIKESLLATEQETKRLQEWKNELEHEYSQIRNLNDSDIK